MERQYIGARYVPKFFENPTTSDSAWLAGVAYEPLTIVTYAGNSYTSKKPVPAGIGAPNTAPAYWVSTGNYNQQIEAISQDLQEFKTDTEENFQAVDDRFDSLNDKKYIIITDSYGNYTNADSKNFISLACEMLGITNFYDFHLGSAGFGRSGDLNFLNVLMNNESVISDKTEITDIFVLGGANDQVSGQNYVNAGISAFCQYVKANYPNAKVYIGFVSKTFELDYYPNFPNALEAYSQCGQYGAVYLTGSEMIMQYNQLMRADHVHPTTEAVDHIAKYVAQLILSHTCHVSFPMESTPFAVSNDAINASIYETSSFAYFDNGKTGIKATKGARLFSINCAIASLGWDYALTGMKLLKCFAPPMVPNSQVFATNALVYHAGGRSMVPTIVSLRSEINTDNSYNMNVFMYPSETLSNVTQIDVAGDWNMNV